MTVRVSCPFCNAGVRLTDLPPGGRVACPRCGESFPVRPGDAVADDALPYPAASTNGDYNPRLADPDDLAPEPVVSAGRAALPLLLLGLLTAVAIVGGGVYSLYFRTPPRATEPTTPSTAKPPATVPPAGVAGLAYLPSDTSVAFAIQCGPLRLYSQRTNADPRQLLTDAGLPPELFAALDRVGLPLDQIDYLCAGLVVGDNEAPPRAVAVLRLTRPAADEAALLKRLKATTVTAPNGTTRYKGADLGVPLLLFELAKPDATTYLFATDGKDLDAAPKAAGRGSGHLPQGLKESTGRLSPASVAWAATDSAAWADKPLVKTVAAALKKPDVLRQLTDVRAVAAGVALEPDPVVTAAVRAADSGAAAAIERRAADTLAGKPVGVTRDGTWVRASGPAGLGAGQWLTELLPTRAK